MLVIHVKRFLVPLAMGILTGAIVFLVIVALNAVLPSPGSIRIAMTAGVFAGSIEAVHVYFQRKKSDPTRTPD